MDFRYSNSKIMRTISCIVLVFFSWTFGIYDMAFAFRGGQQVASNSRQSWNASSQTSSGSSSNQSSQKKPDITFEEALSALEQILLDPNTDTLTKKNSAKVKKGEIEALDVDIKKLFSEIEKTLKDKGLPYEILERHQSFVNLYEENLKELRKYLDAIEKGKNKADIDYAIQNALKFLDKVNPPKKHTPLNPEMLPFRTQEPVFIEPRTDPEQFQTEQTAGITPLNPPLVRSEVKVGHEPILVASIGSLDGLLTQNPTLETQNYLQLALADPPTSDDLAETIEVRFTPEIQAKAAELGHHPVKIYNWVRNNIEFAPTYGSIQGADMCLKTRQCNDFDTASLLVLTTSL